MPKLTGVRSERWKPVLSLALCSKRRFAASHRDKIADDKGQPLEDIINTLAKQSVITGQQSKQAKVAAHVRTKATHAQWDEFNLEGVGGYDLNYENVSSGTFGRLIRRRLQKSRKAHHAERPRNSRIPRV